MRKLMFLVLSLCGYWYALKIGVPVFISNQVNKVEEQGYDIQYTEFYIGKSPLLMAWMFSEPSIQTKDNKESPWRIKSPEILLELNPFNPFAVNISSVGDFEFFQGAGEESAYYSGTIQQLQMKANVTLTGGIDGVDAALEIMNIKVPRELKSPLGTTIEKLALEVEVDGELNYGRLQDTLKNWFEDDGRIDVQYMALIYGPVKVSAAGNIALDKELQPVVSMKTETTGLYQAADLAVEHGYYSSLNRTEAHNVLDTLALNGDEQSGPILELEVNMHDQIVLAGEMRLMKMDKIEW
jgi:Uncharacterized protein conserved in bacteria (DUF2125)